MMYTREDCSTRVYQSHCIRYKERCTLVREMNTVCLSEEDRQTTSPPKMIDLLVVKCTFRSFAEISLGREEANMADNSISII